MNPFFACRRLQRLRVPGVMLVALLQRTPLMRVAATAEAILVSSPIGVVLRSFVAAAASVGTMHSLAGATPLVPSSGTESGISATVGTAVNVAYTVTGTQTPPASWTISGSIPPGLSFSGRTSPGTVNVQTLQLTGTPTTAGSYQVSIVAWEGVNATLTPSPQYSYTITVTGGSTATAPVITTQPQSQTVVAGGNVTFTAAASGSPAPTYQWRKDGTAISGATSATLTLTNVQATNAGSYTVVATNSAGSIPSSAAVLTVSTGGSLAITQQPSSANVATGSTAVFSVGATGATTYQWRLNGANIGGATASTLVITNAAAANAGTYSVVVGNGSGQTATSSNATLGVSTVSAADTGRLTNLSVRTTSGAGDQVLNVGFALNGAAVNKPLLIRVIGPTLGAFGVSGTMGDPTLTIQPLGRTNVVASNDNWGGDSTVVSTSPAVGAFALTNTASADAATVASLQPGTYTALAAGKNNTTGIVLTEIYDATPSASFTATTPRLVNVSARAQVGTGDGILIAGFAVGGTTAKTLLIRATGPALAAFGVGGTLADPKLEVFVLGGAKLHENDNWGGSATITTVSNSVGAFGISDANSKDAVLLVTLPPGVYTAQVSGVGNTTGIALVEVYEVP